MSSSSGVCPVCSGLSTNELLHNRAEELGINPFYIEQRVQVSVNKIKQFIILDKYLNWLRENRTIEEIADENFLTALRLVGCTRLALPVFNCDVDLAVVACDRDNWRDFGYQTLLEEILGCTRNILDSISSLSNRNFSFTTNTC